MHLNDGQLRASLDGELDPAGQNHLAACAVCQTRQAEIAARARRVASRLAGMDVPTQPPAARAAWRTFRARYSQEVLSMSNPRLRPALTALVLVALLGALFAFAPVRAWAGEFLGLFRVQQVRLLPVDTSGLSQLSGNSTLSTQISQLMSDSVTIQQQPGEPQTAADAAEAGRLAGFRVRLPAEAASAPALQVTGASAFEVVLDRPAAQSMLNELGRSDLNLPVAMDGAHVSVSIPAGVTAAYGDCPTGAGQDGPPMMGRRGAGDCILFVQNPSPVVNTPPDLDLESLALIGLQVTGMSADQARQFSATVDWTSTLVIPLPQRGNLSEQISVDGVSGYLVSQPANEESPAQFEVIWVRDGILYALAGSNGPEALLALANSLR